MLAFFDTSIHIDVLRGTRPLADVLDAVGNPPVRLSPVVASELLRGVSGPGTRSVTRLVRGLVPLEPPSWRACWLETGRLTLVGVDKRPLAAEAWPDLPSDVRAKALADFRRVVSPNAKAAVIFLRS